MSGMPCQGLLGIFFVGLLKKKVQKQSKKTNKQKFNLQLKGRKFLYAAFMINEMVISIRKELKRLPSG